MRFYSFKNKNWTFRGSFDKFSSFFPIFLILFLYMFLKKRDFSLHLSCDDYKKTSVCCISELFKKNEQFVMLVGVLIKKKRVIETIRRNYGAVLRATFFMKKNHFFSKLFFSLPFMHCSRKKT